MSVALAITAIAIAIALASLAAVALARLIRTIVELRRITLGLNDALRWAVGHVSSDPAPAQLGARGSSSQHHT